MKVNGGELVVKQLAKENIKAIFGLVGFYVSPIFAACNEYGIEVIGTRHEQAAVHMAESYTQTSGKIGVVAITGGPGLINAVSAITKAYMSQTPLLVIAGSFPPMQKDVGGLEDMEQMYLVKKFSKWTATVYDEKRIPEYIEIAIRNAVCGRRGPVVLEIPINYLLAECDTDDIIWPPTLRTDVMCYGDINKVNEAVKLISNAQKPVLVIGDDLFYTGGEKVLNEFIDKFKIPVLTISASRGIIPDDSEYCFGSGRTIEGSTQLSIYKNSDLIIFGGVPLDYSVSFGKDFVFDDKQIFIQIDTEAHTIGSSSRRVDLGIVGNTEAVLKQMIDISDEYLFDDKFKNWVKECNEHRNRFLSNTLNKKCDNLVNPAYVLGTIRNMISRDSIVVLDGSNAMLWGCALLESNVPGGMIIGPNSTYGQMGAGLPLALGAKYAHPNREVILYTGDGSLGFNFMEIETAVRIGLKVIIVIHNDFSWGFCKESQRLAFGKKKCGYGTQLGSSRYDLAVEALGGKGFYVTEDAQFKDVFKKALETDKITCINVITNSMMSPGSEFLNSSVIEIKEDDDE